MALQRTRRHRLRSGRSLRSLGSPLNAQPLDDLVSAKRALRNVPCIFAASALAFLTACTAATPASKGVTLIRYRPTAEFLAEKDRVQGRCEHVKTEVMGAEGGVGTRQEVRNYAASIGADTVLWWEYSETPFKGGSRAEFFRCGSK